MPPEGVEDKNTDGTNNGGTDPAAGTPNAGGGTPDGGKKPDDASGSDASKGGEQQPVFADQVQDAETREWLSKLQIADVSALAKKAHEQEKLLGKRVALPGENASEEERRSIYKALGMPEKAEEYEFKVPENLPENLPYDTEGATEFKSMAHKLGLTKSQAAGLHDWFAERSAKLVGTQNEMSAEEARAYQTREVQALEKLWGPRDSEVSRANAEFADRALSMAPPEFKDDLQKAGFVGPNGEMINHRFALLMANLGAAIYKEDGVVKGNPAAAGNPFDNTSPHFNLTKAMQLYKSDPEHALSLMKAAGIDPKAAFGIEPKA